MELVPDFGVGSTEGLERRCTMRATGMVRHVSVEGKMIWTVKEGVACCILIDKARWRGGDRGSRSLSCGDEGGRGCIDKDSGNCIMTAKEGRGRGNRQNGVQIMRS